MWKIYAESGRMQAEILFGLIFYQDKGMLGL